MSGEPLRLFLAGDVMTGRGIDQIQAKRGDPALHESWVKSAIHYRMYPGNVDVFEAAGIDCCVLANNHILDWSYGGLAQTLDSLHDAGIITAGAGVDARESRRPAVIETHSGSRVIVVAVGTESSGIPASWSAAADRAGVWLVRSLAGDSVDEINASFDEVRQPGDMAVVSIHWGPNWGYAILPGHRRFAHALIDGAGVDIVHGHSSHHPIGIEIYHNRLILYGCGDLINDYEGIVGHDEFRPHLGVLYLATLTHAGLKELEMIPMRLRRFRVQLAEREMSPGWHGHSPRPAGLSGPSSRTSGMAVSVPSSDVEGWDATGRPIPLGCHDPGLRFGADIYGSRQRPAQTCRALLHRSTSRRGALGSRGSKLRLKAIPPQGAASGGAA